jgi:GrpB-like predicted nucleotidyltransferase (UPF0157 family)/8-oxo-dGTP pyrophosphatase MutT (NUDIX family)
MDQDEGLVIRDYDRAWPDHFAKLAARVKMALGGLVSWVEHIGSTAVPGLASKPIIDLDVVLASQADLPEAIRRLAILGYVHEGDLGITGREAFRCPSGEAQHHLYVLAPEAAELRRHVVFRDALRADPALRDTYAALKRSLAEKHAQDRASYNSAKSAFVLATIGAPADLTGNAAKTSPARRSARVLLMNGRQQVLLIQFVVERQGLPFTFWATPGGGVENDETDVDAARRELREELNLDVDLTGPVHTHSANFEHEGKMVSNTDIFFVGESHVSLPELKSATEAERTAMKALRWWSVTEIEETGEVIFPSDLGEVIRTIRR